MLGAMAGNRLFSQATAAKMSAASGQRKNVIFVMTDQWRYHAQGFAKLDPVQTPVIDQFAAKSFTFHNAIASTPVCCPNRACWMTGRYHQNHGVMRNEETAIRPEQILVSNFKRAGYSTAYIGKWHLSGSFPRAQPTPEHLKKDFDFWYRVKNHTHFLLEYDDHGKMINLGRGWQPEHEVEKAIDYMKQPRENPFFMVLSFGPPHNGVYPGTGEKRHTPGSFSHRAGGYGYYAPPEFEAPYTALKEQDIRGNIRPVPVSGGPVPGETESALGAVPGYFGACAAIDADFGRLLAYLKASGLEKDTIVVFTSDHGDSMGHRYRFSKYSLYEDSLRVPLIVAGPAVPAAARGTRDQRPAELIDLVPTFLAAAGLPVPPELPGENLLAPSARAGAFSEMHGNGSDEIQRAPAYLWRTKDWKLILYFDSDFPTARRAPAAFKGELYDLAADPREWVNRFDDPAARDVRERMTSQLLMHLALANAAWPRRDSVGALGRA